MRYKKRNFFFQSSAEREGFEPSVPFWGTPAFQASTFVHSVISPKSCELTRCTPEFRFPEGVQSSTYQTNKPKLAVCQTCQTGVINLLITANGSEMTFW